MHKIKFPFLQGVSLTYFDLSFCQHLRQIWGKSGLELFQLLPSSLIDTLLKSTKVKHEKRRYMRQFTPFSFLISPTTIGALSSKQMMRQKKIYVIVYRYEAGLNATLFEKPSVKFQSLPHYSLVFSWLLIPFVFRFRSKMLMQDGPTSDSKLPFSF